MTYNNCTHICKIQTIIQSKLKKKICSTLLRLSHWTRGDDVLESFYVHLICLPILVETRGLPLGVDD